MTSAVKYKLFCFVCSLLVLSALNLAQAVVPHTINYQGYLTNTSDQPVNLTESITFKIYPVDSGGVELWEQTKSVEIKDGKFSIELGDGTEPFPADLFDGQLFLGITVGADAEMLPRKPLTSAPFAINSGNAITLQGETLNNILYEDADAIGAMGTKAHANPLNHDRYSHTEAISAMGVKGAGNSLNHDRYNDAEAVSAMGVKGNTNALNHDRYTDSESIGAMGAKSSTNPLNHDRYGDAEAIAAASDEVRTPISSAPFNIHSPGSYYLTGDIISPSTAINISASHVTIDLMGFTLVGSGGGHGVAIAFSRTVTNITIKNGTIRSFAGSGIYVWNGPDDNQDITVTNVKSLFNGYGGIDLSESIRNRISNCTVRGNGTDGIYAGKASIITHNLSANNTGIGIHGGNGSIVKGNIAQSNGGDGISLSARGELTSNTAYQNDGRGIYGGGASSISENVSNENGSWGIYAEGGNIVENNTLALNNSLSTANEGGIRVGGVSRVVGNMVNGNNLNGIYVNGGDSIIESNHVTATNPGIGYNFASAGSAYKNNTSANNATAYGGTQIGSTIDLTGNTSF